MSVGSELKLTEVARKVQGMQLTAFREVAFTSVASRPRFPWVRSRPSF